jgi:hypothetical protein
MSFEALAAQLQKEYEEVPASDRNWLPEDGDYDVVQASFRTGSFQDKKTGEEIPFIAMSYELNGGDYDGTVIDGGMIAIRSPKALGAAKRHVERSLGSLASGVFRDDCEALAQVCEQQGVPCKVRIVTTQSNDGREFRNVYLQSATPPTA